MSDTAENTATRLWRDRVHLREQERDEAQARARLAEEKVAVLTAENDQIAAENARLQDLSDRLPIKIARLSTTAGVDEFWFCGSSVIVWRAAGVVVASPTKRGCDRGRAALPRRDARGAGAPREP